MMVQLLGHATYVLIALSYAVRDIKWLRVIAIPASLCSITFCYKAPEEPLWIPIGWNLVFLVINSIQLAFIVFESKLLKLNNDELFLAESIFPYLRIADVRRVFRQGEIKNVPPDTTLLSAGEETANILLLIEGDVEVIDADGHIIGTCGRGSFLGEIGMLTGNRPTATVRTTSRTRILAWDKREINRFTRIPNIESAIQRALSIDLSMKLAHRTNRVQT